MLKVGDRSPEFSGTDHRGRAVAIPELVQRGPVVVYFYPKSFALNCTAQTCSFRNAYLEFKSMGAEVVGVSLDPREEQQEFALEFRVPFALLSDSGKHLVEIFDVMHFHRLFPKRVTYVIDQNMEIRGVFHHELDMGKHVAEVRALLQVLLDERKNRDRRTIKEFIA